MRWTRSRCLVLSATPNYGWVESDPETFTTFTKGVRVSHGTLTTDANSGFTFEGKSVITNGGTLDALGGRYHSSLYTLNGSVSVGENSSADFSDVHLAGNGTVKLTAESATVSAGGIGGVGAGVHFDLTRGGTLNIDNGMNFLGHVDIGCHATVNINTPIFQTTPLGAVSEIWHAKKRRSRSAGFRGAGCGTDPVRQRHARSSMRRRTQQQVAFRCQGISRWATCRSLWCIRKATFLIQPYAANTASLRVH